MHTKCPIRIITKQDRKTSRNRKINYLSHSSETQSYKKLKV